MSRRRRGCVRGEPVPRGALWPTLTARPGQVNDACRLRRLIAECLQPSTFRSIVAVEPIIQSPASVEAMHQAGMTENFLAVGARRRRPAFESTCAPWKRSLSAHAHPPLTHRRRRSRPRAQGCGARQLCLQAHLSDVGSARARRLRGRCCDARTGVPCVANAYWDPASLLVVRGWGAQTYGLRPVEPSEAASLGAGNTVTLKCPPAAEAVRCVVVRRALSRAS